MTGLDLLDVQTGQNNANAQKNFQRLLTQLKFKNNMEKAAGDHNTNATADMKPTVR